MDRLLFYISPYREPLVNLAIEEKLFASLGESDYMAYFYINSPSVVLGRFQNLWKEIRLSYCLDEGIMPIRRKSGGGCVYHDLGNINYFFAAKKTHYNKDLHFKWLKTVLNDFGVNLDLGKRDDLYFKGMKVSGSAFRNTKESSYHHGTLLINSELDKLKNCLRPLEGGWSGKGVDSNRSTVTNLSQHFSEITVKKVLTRLRNYFTHYAREHKIKFEELPGFSKSTLEDFKTDPFESSPDFGFSFPLFDGNLEIKVVKGRWQRIVLESSFLPIQLIESLESSLQGELFEIRILERIIKSFIAKWSQYKTELLLIQSEMTKRCF